MQTLGALLACRFASCMAQAVTLWTNSTERLLSASLWDGRSWPLAAGLEAIIADNAVRGLTRTLRVVQATYRGPILMCPTPHRESRCCRAYKYPVLRTA